MKNTLIRMYQWTASFFIDPLRLWTNYRALPVYIRNYFRYARLNRGINKFSVQGSYSMFCTYDRYLPAGSINHHYFHQDLWCSRKLFTNAVKEHVDVGSRLDGFVAHVLPFCAVRYVDLRPLNHSIQNLTFIQGSIVELPFQNDSLASVSCLHVIEHIGLGRYGDPVDPMGHAKAAKELARVVSPGGFLYFSTPVGKQQLYFDAHRIFDPQTVLSMFAGLKLESFALIDDSATGVIENATFEMAQRCSHGCGLFIFTKP